MATVCRGRQGHLGPSGAQEGKTQPAAQPIKTAAVYSTHALQQRWGMQVGIGHDMCA